MVVKFLIHLVLPERIELSTSPLPILWRSISINVLWRFFLVDKLCMFTFGYSVCNGVTCKLSDAFRR